MAELETPIGSTLFPRRPLTWVVWGLCGVSLPLAMGVGPLARMLRLEWLSWANWGIALGVGGATAWRLVLDRLRPVR